MPDQTVRAAPGGVGDQYIEEYFPRFPKKEVGGEVITRLGDRDHQILMAGGFLPEDPSSVMPVSFKVAHELRAVGKRSEARGPCRRNSTTAWTSMVAGFSISG